MPPKSSSSTSSTKKRTAILYAREWREYIDILYMTPEKQETKPYRFRFDVYQGKNFDELFQQISEAFCLKCVKALALCSADMDFPNFEDGYNFRKKFKDFFEKNGVFCFVSTLASINQLMLLKNTKTSVDEGEEVLAITATNPSVGIVIGARLLRENGIYRYLNNIQTTNLSFNAEWKRRFLNGTKPKKIILAAMIGAKMDGLKAIFKDEKPAAIMEVEKLCYLADAYYEKVLHAMGEKDTPYNVEFFSQNNFALHYGSQVMLVGSQHLAVPYQKSVVIDVDRKKCITLYGSSTIPTHKPTFLERIKMSSIKSKKAKITFKLDHSSFYELKVEPFDGEEPAQSLSNLSLPQCHCCSPLICFPRKIQVIFDKQNFSICIFENRQKRIIKSLEGSDKTPIYISFTEEKPFFGKPAMEAYSSEPDFVVFDLIKLCSISSADVMNPKWGFRISKDSDADGTIMITMKTAEGERKSSTEFLLALIFKNILKIIKNDIDEVFEEIEIKFDGFSANEILKQTFVKAAELKNVKIVFE